MLGQQRLQVVCTFGDPCWRKADILIEDRCAFRPQLSNDPEQALAYSPVNFDRLSVTGEIQWMEQIRAIHEGACRGFGMVKCRVVRCCELDQQCGGFGIERPPIL